MLHFTYTGDIVDKKSNEPSLASRRNFMGVAAAAGRPAQGDVPEAVERVM